MSKTETDKKSEQANKLPSSMVSALSACLGFLTSFSLSDGLFPISIRLNKSVLPQVASSQQQRNKLE